MPLHDQETWDDNPRLHVAGWQMNEDTILFRAKKETDKESLIDGDSIWEEDGFVFAEMPETARAFDAGKAFEF